MRHINIPIFIPHLGCPNQCIFCNQKYISGTVEFDEKTVYETINDVLRTVNQDDICEIAFFGGSFTGIDRSLMLRLLNIAQEYVDNGKVIGIRMSTRPDYISQEIIDILKKYSITTVELGIQSMNDSVLSYLKRGHTVNDTINATKLLKRNGISFVGQMMIGLPTATKEDELHCAKQICKLGASGTRIYPTLVFKNTELELLLKKGDYEPLSLEEAVDRSSLVLKEFVNNKVDCIRIGLCDSENLHSEDTFVAGPNFPSIGEMVKSRMLYMGICDRLTDNLDKYLNKHLIINCAKGNTSQIIGHKRHNIIELTKKYGFKAIKVIENISLKYTDIKLEIKEENSCD
ncbi:MAG: radical SAM protein [Clostridia bacterium]|nr:radical SAM protein [Clostridia bacterium]